MSNGESGIQKVLCFRRRGDLIIDMIIRDHTYDVMYIIRLVNNKEEIINEAEK